MTESAGLPREFKRSTGDVRAGRLEEPPPPFLREDGTIGKDKTVGMHSRPGAKDKIRAEKRAYKKKARQNLKREMYGSI